MVSSAVFLHAQKQYKTPEHSLGFELSWSASDLSNYRSNSDFFLGTSMRSGFGGSVVASYQYAPKKSFMGFQSGAGFYMWGTRYLKRFNYETESLYAIGIPLVGQFKVSKSFWIESGFQVNFLVYNTLRGAGAWESPEFNIPEVVRPGKVPISELQGVLGFRYHIFKSLAFKARFHYGLTPAYLYRESAFAPNMPGDVYYRYRLNVFELGMSYLFPLKK
jgi:hypothetical protein